MEDSSVINKKILIIEDEVAISDLMEHFLKKEGFSTKAANEGRLGLDMLKNFKPNLIILDLMLPDISGFELCKIITKEYNIPIIMITAKSDINDKVQGLELGADDYITKPFDMREVIVRIKSIFRRINLIKTSRDIIDNDKNNIKVSKDITINKKEHKVFKNKNVIELTRKEHDLLWFFASNKGRAFSRDEILDNVWGIDYFGDARTVDIHVLRLRKKLDDKKGNIIETIFGFGYRLKKGACCDGE